MQYTVQSGDTLSLLALKFYGDASRYQDIVAANPSITDPNLIEVGQVLEIPNTTALNSADTSDASSQGISPSSGAASQVSKYIPYVAAALAVGFVVTSLMGSPKKSSPKEA